MSDIKKIVKSDTVPTPKRESNLLVCICVAVIIVITYLVFSPSLDDGFTNWDDNFYVTDNPLVVNNTLPWVKIFTTPVSAHYHPLTVLSLALNYQWDKLNPIGYHLANILLHLFNTILVFVFIFLITHRNLFIAGIVSLFFGIHPMHVESVTWVSERKDVLYVFFFLAGLIAYVRYSETKKSTWYFFSLIFFILSLLSKEMAVVFPLVLLLVDYLEGVKLTRKLLIEKIPFFLTSILIGIIEIRIQSANAAPYLKLYTAFQRVMFASYSGIIYIIKLFVPYNLSAAYPFPDTNNIPLIFYLAPFIIIAIIVAMVYLFQKKEKEILFGLLFYFVTIVLVLQFIPANPTITPDRYSYLSYIGLLFTVAVIINKIWQQTSSNFGLIKYTLIIILFTGTMLFSIQTYSRTQVWKDSQTLWNDAINNYPEAAIAYYDRGCLYYENDDAKDAMADFNKDIELNPLDKFAYYDRGVLYSRFYNRNDLAMTDYNKTIQLDSTYAKAWLSRGVLYSAYGKNDSAMYDLNKSIKLNPDYADAYTNLGMLYYRMGNNNYALDNYNKAIVLDSVNVESYNDRGVIYANSGRKDLAIADYNKAITIKPEFAPAYYNRALYYNALMQYGKAVSDFSNAIQFNPQNADYYNARGACYVSLQNYTAALCDFSKAIALNPSVATYWNNRSVIENKLGQNEPAKADELKAQQLQGK